MGYNSEYANQSQPAYYYDGSLMDQQSSFLTHCIAQNHDISHFERAIVRRMKKLILSSIQYAEDDVISFFIMVCRAANMDLMLDDFNCIRDCYFHIDDYCEDIDGIMELVEANEQLLHIQKLAQAYFQSLMLTATEYDRPDMLSYLMNMVTACGTQTLPSDEEINTESFSELKIL